MDGNTEPPAEPPAEPRPDRGAERRAARAGHFGGDLLRVVVYDAGGRLVLNGHATEPLLYAISNLADGLTVRYGDPDAGYADPEPAAWGPGLLPAAPAQPIQVANAYAATVSLSVALPTGSTMSPYEFSLTHHHSHTHAGDPRGQMPHAHEHTHAGADAHRAGQYGHGRDPHDHGH